MTWQLTVVEEVVFPFCDGHRSWGTVTVVRGDAKLGIYARCPDAVAHLKALGEAGTCVVDAVTARRNVSCFDQQPTR